MAIRIGELIGALESLNEEMLLIYNLDTQELVSLFDYSLIHEYPNRLILPRRLDIHEYDMMKSFAESLEGSDKERLLKALDGKGAFKRFQEELFLMHLQTKWSYYRDDEYEKIGRQWCEKHQVELIG